jgi:5-methylcytosine-specific restriction enzyme B
MTRWHKAPEVLEAARTWKERCLLSKGSILSEKSLWTSENIGQLKRHYLENLDAGEGTFLSKLEEQLRAASPPAKQLAAELLWILYLCVSASAMGGDTKRRHIMRVWSWSGEELPQEGLEMLGSVLDQVSIPTSMPQAFSPACPT